MDKDQEIKRLKDKITSLEEERQLILERGEDLILLAQVAERINRLESEDSVIDLLLEDTCILKGITYASFIKVKRTSVQVTNEYTHAKITALLNRTFKISECPNIEKTLRLGRVTNESLTCPPEELPFLPNIESRAGLSVALIACPCGRGKRGVAVFCCLGPDAGVISAYLPLLNRLVSVAGSRIEVINLTNNIRRLNAGLKRKSEVLAKELRASERKYRTLFEQANDAIYLIDAGSGKILECNRRAAEIDGYSRRELKGMSVLELFPNQERYRTLRAYTGTDGPVGAKSGIVGLHHRRRDGRLIPVEISNAAVELNESRVNISIVRDVSRRLRTREELRRAKEKSENYAEELEVLINIISTISSSLRLESVLRRTVESAVELIGGDAGSIAVYDERLQVMTYPYHYKMPPKLARAVATKGHGLAEQIMLTGEPLIVEDYPGHPRALPEFVAAGLRVLAAAPITIKGKNIGALGVFGFSADKKFSRGDLKVLAAVGKQAGVAMENARLYNSLRELSKDLEKRVKERTRQLEVANEKLKELDKLKSMFIATTSHELRTPLNSIIGFSGILLEGWSGDLTSEQRENLEYVYQSGRHLLALINDIIDISKVESGKLDLQIERFQLKEVIDEAVKSFKSELSQKNLAFKVDVEDLEIENDRRRLYQCLVNLLSNAVKFTVSGEIRVRAEKMGDRVKIAVSDTGIGLRKSDMNKLFKPFSRLDSPLRERTSGTGLGLYLTKKLVEESLGGQVTATGKYHQGSTFTLIIPRQRKREDDKDSTG